MSVDFVRADGDGGVGVGRPRNRLGDTPQGNPTLVWLRGARLALQPGGATAYRTYSARNEAKRPEAPESVRSRRARIANSRRIRGFHRTHGKTKQLDMVLEAGIPAGVLNIVHGYGKETGEPLCAHPDVRAISLTGSTATGDRIVRSAGLKRLSMELGGKSLFVLFDDADLERALDAALFLIFSNNGERCIAGPRILVQRSVYADFAARFAERARSIAVGDPMAGSTIVGPMISQGHPAKVRSYVALGPKEGATLLCGGLDAPASHWATTIFPTGERHAPWRRVA